MKPLSALVLIDVAKSLHIIHPHAKELAVDESFSIITPLVIDFILGQVVFGPLITTCWRGAWIGFNLLLDNHLFPNHPDLNTAGCVILGVSGINLMTYVPALFHYFCEDFKSGWVFFALSRTFTILAFGSGMILWKGWWDVCSMSGASWNQGLAFLGVGMVIMMCLGNSRSNIGFPLAIRVDSRDKYFHLNGFTLLDPKTTEFSNQWVFLFTVINLILTTFSEVLVISCWFGVWTIEDSLSASWVGSGSLGEAFASCCIGVSVATLTFSVQFWFLQVLGPTSNENDIRSAVLHFCANQVLASLGLVATVSNLRGIWYLLDLILPEDTFSWTLLGSFVLAFSSLELLGIATTLHGGIIQDPKPGDPFLIHGFYTTYFYMNKLKFQCNSKNPELYLDLNGRAPLASSDTETPMTEIPIKP
ncbi:hypothetical protein TCAL_04478 [Tigriopus californicus]|uniref:Uncharacterized protein n=1 Tax=Tigriopus californicus TaxID=6832 RepID=A0A553NXH9_TIGCA|nr:uncharacterized protein LOC131886433 [Tigriopus californicus]TRY70129.1 hypothetical protein TCAL_04478 [Tigriopus californicus]|eukprot:TCALIF_04478-PA protein Name:"Protein of unknown function" AED:0.41 eAED:0.41 QI:55/0.25/0/0.4/0.75/0.8/5/0/417